MQILDRHDVRNTQVSSLTVVSSLYLPAYLCIHPSIHPSIHPPTHPCLFAYLSSIHSCISSFISWTYQGNFGKLCLSLKQCTFIQNCMKQGKWFTSHLCIWRISALFHAVFHFLHIISCLDILSINKLILILLFHRKDLKIFYYWFAGISQHVWCLPLPSPQRTTILYTERSVGTFNSSVLENYFVLFI